MSREVTLRGRVVGARTVEVDAPLPEGATDVEVVVRVPVNPAALAEYLEALPPGTRTTEDIDEQLREERGSWRL